MCNLYYTKGHHFWNRWKQSVSNWRQKENIEEVRFLEMPRILMLLLCTRLSLPEILGLSVPPPHCICCISLNLVVLPQLYSHFHPIVMNLWFVENYLIPNRKLLHCWRQMRFHLSLMFYLNSILTSKTT